MVNQANQLYVGILLFIYAICTYGSNSLPESNILELCPQWNTCRHMRREYLRDFTQRNCECDFLCTAFKDCCIDAKARKKYPYYFKNRLDTCYRYGIYDEAIYVVGSCPRNYNESTIVKKFCEGRDDFRDPMMSTPVSDTSSASTYRNKYCASCNGALSSTLVPWKMYLKFDDSHPELTDLATVIDKDFVYSHDFKKLGVCEGDTFRPFEVVFQKPESVSDVRHCRYNLISSCPLSWHNETIMKACQSYMGVVHHQHQSYRNVHCAICNGVDVKQLTCSEHIRLARNVRPEPFLQSMDINVSHGGYIDRFSSVQVGRYMTIFRKICRDGACFFNGFELRDTGCPKKQWWEWF